MRLVLAALLAASVAVAPMTSADTATYRDVPNPPSPGVPPTPSGGTLPPSPPDSPPPSLPDPPCTREGFAVDCNPIGNWATISVPAWASSYSGELLAWEEAAGSWTTEEFVPAVMAYEGELADWQGDTVSWATVEFETWANGVPARFAQDEFDFLGPTGTTNATIHVHDIGPLQENVVFVVWGGSGGEHWLCEHACTVPDTGFTVSVDPLDVPPNVWVGMSAAFPLPNAPATKGEISVTFS